MYCIIVSLALLITQLAHFHNLKRYTVQCFDDYLTTGISQQSIHFSSRFKCVRSPWPNQTRHLLPQLQVLYKVCVCKLLSVDGYSSPCLMRHMAQVSKYDLIFNVDLFIILLLEWDFNPMITWLGVNLTVTFKLLTHL